MVNRLHPGQNIPGLGQLALGDFWSWAYSDVLSNRNRSIFAEFLVALALDLIDTPRIEWDAVDLRYRDREIEVKSAAYLQSWSQERPSVIRFDIAEKRAWDAKMNHYNPEPGRRADCYVFCLYSETELARVDILEIDAWHFYVIPTRQIVQELGRQKSVGLRRVQTMCEPVNYGALKERIDSVLKIR